MTRLVGYMTGNQHESYVTICTVLQSSELNSTI